jgi:ubiquinone/menaquinone biosynthesis C-methylase UbiE
MEQNLQQPNNFPFISYEEYNKQGELYVATQREFYSDTPDTGRNFFRNAIESNIKNKSIADVGCGAGDDLITYKNMGARRVVGIEPSSVMLKAAEKSLEEKGLTIELLEGQWDKLPLPDESVDVVTSRYSFHIIPNFEKAFKEVSRVLKSGGNFLIAVPHPKYDAKLAREQGVDIHSTIKSSLFGGKIIVENYQHSVEEYTSGTVLDYFSVEEVVTYSMHEDVNENEPTALLMRYRKK